MNPIRCLRMPVVALVAAHAALASGVRAQAPPGSDSLSAAAVAESLSVLRDLERIVRENRNDAAAWHRIGMIAWALYERDQHPPPMPGLDWTLLGRQADTALRLAALIDQENPLYVMSAGRFLLNSGVSITRAGSYGFFSKAIEAARTSGNPYVIAETAVDAGRVYWRRYDSFADRWMGTRPCLGAETFRSLLPAPDGRGGLTPQGARIVRNEVEQSMMELRGASFPGEADYIRAEELFREAFDAQPSFQRGFRQLAMLLVARNRWRELHDVARRRIEDANWDAWAWMTLGLALHRLEAPSKVVAAAFDSAFVYLPEEDRRRLDRFERVLRRGDSARVNAIAAADLAAVNRYYWLTSDPLWSLEGNEPRLEFLARVTYAELRWTVDEMGVRGADSDRGDIHIRYGPPDLVLSFRTLGDVCTIWAYDTGLKFAFTGPATFATARIPFDDREMVEAIIEVNPVRWDNMSPVRARSMPVQIARFRGGRDSVDVYVAVLPPLDSIRQSSDVNSAVRTDFWLLEGGIAAVARDSVRPTPPGAQTFTHRVARGWYTYRAEATADGALYGGTAGDRVFAHDTTGFTTSGFGMSDVVLASRATPRSGTADTWRELAIVPQFGAAPAGGSVALVWENYGLASSQGTARYALTVTLERQRSAAGRIAARIVGAAGRAVGLDQSEDRLTIRFEREAPHRDVVLENLTLALGETPTGTYRLTVEVLDHETGATTSRVLELTIGD